MNATTIDTLNSLLRGEISAIETYRQALDKLNRANGATDELRRVHAEHREAANALRQEVHREGGQPDQGSGIWGAFARVVEGTAKLFGRHAALKALKEGEEVGIRAYEKAIRAEEVTADCKNLIAATLLPRARAHVATLDRLLCGAVERITPQEARTHLASGQAMLVCAYEGDEKFEKYHLDGAMPLYGFEAQADSIPKNREIIFYCA
jgi:uncharacterized protein (TIGR02284 family)